jgi:hypothetical protein
MEHEIARRVFDERRQTIAETFVRVANEVLGTKRTGSGISEI